MLADAPQVLTIALAALVVFVAAAALVAGIAIVGAIGVAISSAIATWLQETPSAGRSRGRDPGAKLREEERREDRAAEAAAAGRGPGQLALANPDGDAGDLSLPSQAGELSPASEATSSRVDAPLLKQTK